MCKISLDFLTSDAEEIQIKYPLRTVCLPLVYYPLLITLTPAGMVEGSVRCLCHKAPQGVTRMHILWVCVLFILPGRSLALTGPNNITARVGSTVTIPCQYENYYTNYQKYWCRGWYSLFCSVIVESTHWRQQGRTSISDNRRHHTFTVTMEELREDDTGYYWCGVSAPGRDPMLFVKLTVLRDSSSVNPTAEIISLPTEASTTTEAEASKSVPLEETVLEILVPIIAMLFFLLLLTTALFLRERRKRKQGMERETSKSRNMHNSDKSPDLSTLYAVIEKADNADAQTACMENTAISTEPVDCSEEGQPSPTISDTFPIYAVVKKVRGSQGIDNPAMDTARPEPHYEEIHFPPVAPHTIPVYAVVKKFGARKASENQTSTIETATGGEDFCEEKMLRRRAVSGTTDPSTASDQQLELYSTVDFTDMAPSEEPQYYLLTK